MAGPHIAPIDYKRQGKALAGYAFMPQLLPRIRETFFTSFNWLAYLMTLICVNFRLLPPTTPHMLPQNFQSLTLHGVLASAFAQTEWSWKNIDRIIVLFTLFLAVGLLLFYLVTLVVFLLMTPAYAATIQGISLDQIFVMQFDPQKDIAFGLLDRIFGIPDLFNSQYEGMAVPYHKAIQNLFTLYGKVFIVLALFLLFYHLLTIVFETLRTGRPLGERFQSPFLLMRLIVAIGLLVPVAHGYNSGQYIVLYIAKFGSSFASNAWKIYSVQSTDTGAPPIDIIPSGDQGRFRYLVASPRTPVIDSIVYYLTLARTCKRAYEKSHENGDFAYPTIDAFLVKAGGENRRLADSSLGDAVNFTRGDHIAIRFGVEDETSFAEEKGHVMPFCGEIVLPIKGIVLPDPETPGDEAAQAEQDHKIAGWWVQAAYLHIIRDFMTSSTLDQPINCIVTNKFPGMNAGGGCATGDVDLTFIEDLKETYREDIREAIEDAVNAVAAEDGPLRMDGEVYSKGWAGAGIFYSRLAGVNGDAFTAAYAIPTPLRFPRAMEEARQNRAERDESLGGMNQFCPDTSEGQAQQGATLNNRIVVGLCDTYRDLVTSVNEFGAHSQQRSSNIIYNVMNFLFELDALYNMRESRDTHPMAALSGLGRAMIEKAMRNFFIATGTAAIGGLFTGIDLLTYADAKGNPKSGIADAAKAIGGAIMSMAMVGLVVGFIFFYIIPMMPFIYFFFAVARWVKSVFEAMIGIPLWALAHLRLNGEGLPGQAAAGGYFLLLEIFTRPIIVLFAFFAAMGTFNALVTVLNDIFENVTANLTGFELQGADISDTNMVGYFRGGLDRFFYVVVYVAVVYMMALSSFKLIDLIPNTIIRWMAGNVQVKPFSDGQQDAVQSITQYAAFGGAGISEQLGKATIDAAYGGTAALGSLMRSR